MTRDRETAKEKHQRGEDHESLVLHAFALTPNEQPSWLKEMRIATHEEDAMGLDIIATVTMPYSGTEAEVGFQIKSSLKYAERFIATHPGTSVLIVKKMTTAKQVRRKIIQLLDGIRKGKKRDPPVY